MHLLLHSYVVAVSMCLPEEGGGEEVQAGRAPSAEQHQTEHLTLPLHTEGRKRHGCSEV
jgi:hypothetical protein